MKILLSTFLLIGVLSTPILSASTGDVASVNNDERGRHTASKQCPNSNKRCGRWYYGRANGLSVSDFMANYNYPSGYGSQASMITDNNIKVKAIDSDRGKYSEAYAHTGDQVLHYYYAYYS